MKLLLGVFVLPHRCFCRHHAKQENFHTFSFERAGASNGKSSLGYTAIIHAHGVLVDRGVCVCVRVWTATGGIGKTGHL